MGASAPWCFRSCSSQTWQPPHPYPESPPQNPLRSCCPPPHSGSLSVLPTVLGFPVHTCTSVSFLSLSSHPSGRPLLPRPLRPGPSGSGLHWESGHADSLRRERLALPPLLGDPRRAGGSEAGLFLRCALAARSSPARPSPCPWPLLFCPITFACGCLILSFFLPDTPFMDILFDCSEGEGVGGKAWLLGGTSMCGKPKVKHIPFLVLEPPRPTPPVPRPRAWLPWKQSSPEKAWLPFPRGRCPPFLAGPLPIPVLSPPSALLSSFRRSLAHLSCAATISFLSRWPIFLPLPGPPPHLPLLSLRDSSPLFSLSLPTGAPR